MKLDDHGRLRVLLVNSGLGYGGAETQLIAIAQELIRRGHEVAVYLLTQEASRASELTRLGIPVIVDHKRTRLDAKVIRRLRSFIREWRPQLVHGLLFDANIYTRLAAIGMGIPVINSERSHGYRMTLAQRAIHVSTRWLVDAVIANTYAGCAFAQDMYRFGPDKSFTVWNGVDLADIDARCSGRDIDYRQEFFGSSNLKMAVMVGTIKPAKDHLLAIEVAEALIDSGGGDWGVAFVGAAYRKRLGYESPAEKKTHAWDDSVCERLRNSRHADRIRLVGHRDDALQVIASADVLFSTSRNEGFPNVVLEAMAVRTPVISTDYSDIRVILEDSFWTVPSRDAAEIAARILDVSACRAVTGARLREWVERHATIARSVDALQRVYGICLRHSLHQVPA